MDDHLGYGKSKCSDNEDYTTITTIAAIAAQKS